MNDLQDLKMETNSQDEEKTFTQDDVNRIVQERLKREKDKNTNDSIDSLEEKENNLNKRELLLDCREALNENGLNSEFIKLFKGNSSEDLEDFINIAKGITESLSEESKRNMEGRFNSHVPPNGVESNFNPIKEAFKYPGLNK
ncbi:type I site-specific restriction-modification system R (restriction) subunit [Peptoniphilus koenoeneniae]|uniref:Type I site-specific restriction-modification system R (Restriction) subunit n=1 Tax=Peptoniphilus koenoeneniae TaxID=507751 RepID=A0ABU0AWA1_9FIRM|nr:MULTISPECIES: hypothetical protein [Peptoniphilus]ERT56286.1 hypothetical protein HMPREF1253_1420 [Peptoniphilus sp. BV3C26]MDQ0275310.1 type I site-specific restriction-modification system R (restriction) subunit [Peptoniphilus koenoeneniae]